MAVAPQMATGITNRFTTGMAEKRVTRAPKLRHLPRRCFKASRMVMKSILWLSNG
ncbi:hypothetical protein D1872_322730 [compost metagenome]